MFLMINNLAERESIEVGDHCIDFYVYGALIEVPIYDDENLDLDPCARAGDVPEEVRPSS
jgi:hypothetical protein